MSESRTLGEIIREALKQRPSLDELQGVIYREALMMNLNVTLAADFLGITRQTMCNRMKKHKICLGELKREKQRQMTFQNKCKSFNKS